MEKYFEFELNNNYTCKIKLQIKYSVVKMWDTYKLKKDMPVLIIDAIVLKDKEIIYAGESIEFLEKFKPKDNSILYNKILDLYNKWAFHDMCPYDKKQYNYLINNVKDFEEKNHDTIYKILDNEGLNSEHKYGHEWLYKPLPDNVLNDIIQLIKR